MYCTADVSAFSNNNGGDVCRACLARWGMHLLSKYTPGPCLLCLNADPLLNVEGLPNRLIEYTHSLNKKLRRRTSISLGFGLDS